MAITVRKYEAQVKDPATGNMIPAGLLSSDSLAAINTAKNKAVSLVTEVGVNVSEAIQKSYRGKNLGTSITSAQLTAISSGTFDNLYIGDYWTINGTRYDIADMDYWYNCGDLAFTKHHLVMIPHYTLYSAKMNSTNTTVGAYVGSAMYTGTYDSESDEKGLTRARTKIATDFGANLLTHRILLNNAVTNGYVSGYLWIDSTVDLMSEKMVYGTQIYSAMPNGSTIPAQYTIDKTQLAIFRIMPTAINIRQSYWLRDVVSGTAFAYVSVNGTAAYPGASYSYGVRPAFAVGVA